jgi:ubiquitin carboxyl-terminal hydrolase 8
MAGESKWKCPQCKAYRDAVKKIDIWRLPPLLIIHLKRFKYQGIWRDKITTLVDFPIENLDMNRYILNTAATTTNSGYNLYATSNHSGTLDGGHYTALCRHFQFDKWFKFDDTEVKDVSSSSLVSPTSYILFYARN